MTVLLPQSMIDAEAAVLEAEPAACPAQESLPQVEDDERWDGLS